MMDEPRAEETVREWEAEKEIEKAQKLAKWMAQATAEMKEAPSGALKAVR